MNISEDFETNRYLHLNNFLSKKTCDELTEYLRVESSKTGFYDMQCSKSKSLRDNPVFDKLLAELLPDVEEVVGKKLFPTYAFARWYVPGEELLAHQDRESCEISVTLTLGYDGNVWPIYMGHDCVDKVPDKIVKHENGKFVPVQKVSKISMQVGDAVVYHGCELIHWREKYEEGNWQAQVFLHYVDANGPYKDFKFDNRKSLSHVSTIPDTSDDNDLTYWAYTDVFSPEDCDILVKAYTSFDSVPADVGVDGISSTRDSSIRNVGKLELPTYKGIGATLAAVGLDANQQRWKFDVTKANQCEFLRYPSGGGRYKGHIDTIMLNLPAHQNECRKLTVLVFLNDDFTGGKFFLQFGPNKFYPPQNKGTVLVFPSFLLHGVEDVEQGERFSAVCWLVGPWFK